MSKQTIQSIQNYLLYALIQEIEFPLLIKFLNAVRYHKFNYFHQIIPYLQFSFQLHNRMAPIILERILISYYYTLHKPTSIILYVLVSQVYNPNELPILLLDHIDDSHFQLFQVRLFANHFLIVIQLYIFDYHLPIWCYHRPYLNHDVFTQTFFLFVPIFIPIKPFQFLNELLIIL